MLFAGDFSDPRPPEEADVIVEMTKSQFLDTSVLDNDPATSDLLMQLFLSDLTPKEELNKLGAVSSTTPPTLLDVDHEKSVASTASTPMSSLATVPQLPSPEPLLQSDSSASSEAPSPADGNTSSDDIISTLMLSASPLECNDTSGFTDPLDNPFLTECTDFSDFLQDPCVLNVSTMLTSTNTTTSSSSSSQSFSLNVSSDFSLSQSPIRSNTDIHDNISDTHDLNLLDLSQTSSTVPSFDATELENLDIDFSVFSADTLSLVPGSPDELTTDLSIMLTQAQPQSTPTTPGHEVSRDQPTTNSKSDDVSFESSTPSPSTVNDELSVHERPIGSPIADTPRKRTASDMESDTGNSAPDPKKTKMTRRQKNNIASQVSRAKRKAKNVAMSDRVSELESENAMLRIQEKELTTEIERLKKLLVTRLSQ